MNSLLQDLRFALRQMRRSPGFALTAILTLALGIAANVIVFGVLQSLVLQPLDVPNSDRIWQLGSSNIAFPVFSYPEIRTIRDHNTAFAAVAAEVTQNFGLDYERVTRPIWGLEVSGQYFEVLAIKPALGRLLNRADDDHPGASDATVLSWDTWKGQFAGDPNIVGKIIRLNKHPYTIVGVTPQGFNGTEKFLVAGIFVPMANQESLEGVSWLNDWHNRNLFAMARTRDGVSTPQLQTDLKAIAAEIERENPKEEEKLSLSLARPGLIGDYIGAPARAFVAGIMGLAGIVLLAACANLGGLFAARTADRAREISIRMAVGSPRWRILRQVLVEALLIAILGGASACALAWAALTALAQWHPPSDYPIQFHVTPQPTLILAAFLISIASAVLFGIMPLRQIFQADPNDAIKSGGAQSSPSGRRWPLRDLLLAAQIALCCVTVTAAFVSLRGLARTNNLNLGVDTRNVVLTRFDLSQSGYKPEAAGQFEQRILERIAHLPGVEAAAYANTTPHSNPSISDIYAQPVADLKPSNKSFSAYLYDVSPGFFAAAHTPLLAGRDVSFADTLDKPRVAVVNQTFAHRLFPAGDALGRFYKNHAGQLIQIVGIVGDGKYFLLSEDQAAAEFFPIPQDPSTGIDLIVRSPGDQIAMEDAVRKAIADLDPTIPLHAAGTWDSQLALIRFPSQVATAALGLFGAFGLLLSITGTFGLATYTVNKRLRELSIRVALGAQAPQILSAALGRLLLLLATGSVIGLALGAATSHLLAAIVYQASAQDPVVLASVALTMILTGLLSVASPIRRALHIDPATLLRED